MSRIYAELIDFQESQIWLGEGNSELGCTFTVVQGGRRTEGLRAYFIDGRFVVDTGGDLRAPELVGALQTDPHFPEVVQDYLRFGMQPSAYYTKLAA